MGIGTANNGKKYYTAVRVFGDEVSTDDSADDYDFIAWPASGNNLSETFSVNTPWSVTVNPDRYQTPDASSITVTITNRADGTSWTFDQSTGTGTDSSCAYFSVNNSGYGVRNCIIFRPAYNELSSYSGEYIVNITGLKTVDGNDTSLTYKVLFASATASNDNSTGTNGSTGQNSEGSKDETTDKNTSVTKIKLTTQNTSVKLSKTTCVYDGTEKKPTVKVYNSNGKIIEKAYYTVTYKNNTQVGKATITVKFKDKYTGTIRATYTIKPKATSLTGTTPKSKSIALTWKQTKQVSGYQIQYAANSKFTKGKTTICVNSTKKTSKNITGLSAKTKYYIRIRTYKTVDGKNYYSAWSQAKTVKTK